MKKKFALFFLTLSLGVTAQFNEPYSVYFQSGKTSPNEIAAKQFTSWLDSLLSLNSVTIEKIELIGFCDSIGSASANLILSQKRTESIRKIIIGRLPSVIVTANAQGEDNPHYNNQESISRSKNRRVDIHISFINNEELKNSFDKTASKETVNKSNENKIKTEKDCSRDTILTYPQGTQIKLKVCDYEKYFRDCPIKITEYIDPQSIRDAGLRTRSNRGEQLTTGGMFKIEWCSKNKFPVEIEVSLPEPPCLDPNLALYQWTLDESNNTWQSTNKLFERSRDKDGRLITQIINPGFINCDAVLLLVPSQVKFVAQEGLKIKNIRVFYTCPNPSVYEDDLADKKSSKKVKMNLPCPDSEPHIYVRAEDREGNNYYLHYTKLNNLKMRKWRPICGRGKRITKTQKGFDETRNMLLSKKYKLKKSNFDMTIPVAKNP